MTNPNPPLSRRTLMKIASVAPLVAATSCVTPSSVKQGRDDLLRLAGEVPEDQLKEVVKRARAGGLKGSEEKTFTDVATTLWSYFLLGLGNVPIKSGEQLLIDAYVYKSGNLIVGHVNDGKFKDEAEHQLTILCAYTCGHRAACIALDECGESMGPEVTRAIYRKAWDQTERVIKKKMKKVEAIGGTVAEERPALGYGC